MVEEKKSKFFFLGYIQRCPFYKPIPILIVLVLIALGTWGIYYFNPWVALGYSIYSLLFYFLLMPFTICKHCYFRIIVTSIDEEKGKITKKLMSVDEWGKTLLHKHVGQKHWTWAMTVIWILPIVLIIISFFREFSYLALISLIGFIIALVGFVVYLLKVKCPSCSIQEECHSSF